MTKLKLGAVENDKPVRLTVERSATVHHNSVAYADILGRTSGQPGPIRQTDPTHSRAFQDDRPCIRESGAIGPLGSHLVRW